MSSPNPRCLRCRCRDSEEVHTQGALVFCNSCWKHVVLPVVAYHRKNNPKSFEDAVHRKFKHLIPTCNKSPKVLINGQPLAKFPAPSAKRVS